MSSVRRWLALSWAVLLLCGCGAGALPDAPPPCDQACRDGVALRGVRETMKLAYNVLIQGKPVGAQDGSTPCRSSDGSQGGRVRLFGNATSNAIQGSSFVELEYEFEECAYSVPPSATAEHNYNLILSGRVKQQGTLAVQPSSTTALLMGSESIRISGTVYDPPVDYEAVDCVLAVAQQGSRISGTLCGRNAGFTF